MIENAPTDTDNGESFCPPSLTKNELLTILDSLPDNMEIQILVDNTIEIQISDKEKDFKTSNAKEKILSLQIKY